MKVTISFRHLDHTDALDDRIHEKSEKLLKYLGGKTHIKWSCFVKQGQHWAEVDLSGPNYQYHATAHTDSLYKTIDVVMDKLERQLSKKKQKMKVRRHKSHSENILLDPEMAWAEYDEERFGDMAS